MMLLIMNFPILNTLQASAGVLKDNLVDFTKQFNVDIAPNAVDSFMDTAKGMGHRIVHGHDLSYLPEIFSEHGVSGVGDYFAHLGKDIMRPHGVPIPFANEIKNGLGLSTATSIDWLALNIGDVFAGGFSVWHSYENYNLLSSGVVSKSILIQIAVGSTVKLVAASYFPNPISFLAQFAS